MQLHAVVYTHAAAPGKLVFHSAFDIETFEANPEPAHAAVEALRKQPEIRSAGIVLFEVPDSIVIPYLVPNAHPDRFIARVDTVQ